MTFVAEMRTRTKGHLPLHEWGPVCAGCGGDEFRIDGYCSIECRDYHCDDAELFGAVLNLIEAAQEARRWMATDDRYGRYAAAKFDEALAPFLSDDASAREVPVRSEPGEEG